MFHFKQQLHLRWIYESTTLYGHKPFTIYHPFPLGIFLFMTPVPGRRRDHDPDCDFLRHAARCDRRLCTGYHDRIDHPDCIGHVPYKACATGIHWEITIFTTLFDVRPVWVFVRLIGAIFAVMTLFKLGPEWVWSDATGGLLLNPDGLLTILFSVFYLQDCFCHYY